MKKFPWACVLGILSIFITAFGAYQYLERYALAEDLHKIEQRLDYKVISDQVEYKQLKIDQIEDKYKNVEKAPEPVKKEYNKLQREKGRLEKKLDALEKK